MSTFGESAPTSMIRRVKTSHVPGNVRGDPEHSGR